MDGARRGRGPPEPIQVAATAASTWREEENGPRLARQGSALQLKGSQTGTESNPTRRRQILDAPRHRTETDVKKEDRA